MKNILKRIGISVRSEGIIEEYGTAKELKILSYDIIGEPGFNYANFSNTNEYLNRIKIEFDRQKLNQDRKEKLDKLKKL